MPGQWHASCLLCRRRGGNLTPVARQLRIPPLSSAWWQPHTSPGTSGFRSVLPRGAAVRHQHGRPPPRLCCTSTATDQVSQSLESAAWGAVGQKLSSCIWTGLCCHADDFAATERSQLPRTDLCCHGEDSAATERSQLPWACTWALEVAALVKDVGEDGPWDDIPVRRYTFSCHQLERYLQASLPMLRLQACLAPSPERLARQSEPAPDIRGARRRARGASKESR